MPRSSPLHIAAPSAASQRFICSLRFSQVFDWSAPEPLEDNSEDKIINDKIIAENELIATFRHNYTAPARSCHRLPPTSYLLALLAASPFCYLSLHCSCGLVTVFVPALVPLCLQLQHAATWRLFSQSPSLATPQVAWV